MGIIKGDMSDSVTNYNYVGNSKVSVSIKKTNANKCTLKELEHRKLGWKVLFLKYNVGKILSKEMWCKMAETITFLDYIFKKMKNACNVRYIFFCVRGQENDFPSLWMVYWKCSGLCTLFFKTSTWYLLFMLHYAVI